MLEGDIKTIRELDRLLSETCELNKDSSNKGSKAYTKVYSLIGNPVFKKIRLFFDEREGKGTVKIKDYHPIVLGLCTFVLVQYFALLLSWPWSWL